MNVEFSMRREVEGGPEVEWVQVSSFDAKEVVSRAVVPQDADTFRREYAAFKDGTQPAPQVATPPPAPAPQPTPEPKPLGVVKPAPFPADEPPADFMPGFTEPETVPVKE